MSDSLNHLSTSIPTLLEAELINRANQVISGQPLAAQSYQAICFLPKETPDDIYEQIEEKTRKLSRTIEKHIQKEFKKSPSISITLVNGENLKANKPLKILQARVSKNLIWPMLYNQEENSLEHLSRLPAGRISS